ncbi:MAG TPA: amidohydrolase family protein, partial [Chloroflexota bacterium]|nr:amidohydrolase family protein [Chloroflexota bacterium]
MIKSGRVIDPSRGIDTVASILIDSGRVVEVGMLAGFGSPRPDREVDANGLIVTPGFVDLHAHLRYPGLPDKETIASGTSAAIRGGFTTVCAMANSKPPVDSGSRVETVQARIHAEARCRVHVIGAVSRGLDGHELADSRELAEAGVVALSDDGNPVTDQGLMRSALTESEKLGIPVSAHEETRLHKNANGGGCWPCSGEVDMVRRDLALLRATGGRLHIAHVSCAESAELIAKAQSARLQVTAEATPH